MNNSIQVECKSCGTKFRADSGTAGKTGPCPKCGEPITVSRLASLRTPAPVPLQRGQHNLHEILSTAIRTGELVSITYHGGSQPGTVREIRPVAISSTEVRAHDNTNAVKTFVLSKIELPDKDTIAPSYDPNAMPVEDSRTIKEVFEPKIAQFLAMGWHAELGENGISLHYYFKNGKPRKSPALSLSFDEFIIDIVLDEDDWETWVEEKRKSKRPYHVSSPTYQGPGFAKLSRALAVFMAESEKHRPGASITA